MLSRFLNGHHPEGPEGKGAVQGLPDEGADRGRAGASRHDDEIGILQYVQREPHAVGSPDEEILSLPQILQGVRQAPHGPDGELDPVGAKGADGERGLADLRQGDLEKLARRHIGRGFHREGEFEVRLGSDGGDLRRERPVGIVRHFVSPPFRASDTRLMHSEKEIYSGQTSSHRPHPTHMS